jgi:hypothetical protein
VFHSIDYRPWCASLTHTLGFRIDQLSVVGAYTCKCSIEFCLKPCLTFRVVRLTPKGIFNWYQSLSLEANRVDPVKP